MHSRFPRRPTQLVLALIVAFVAAPAVAQDGQTVEPSPDAAAENDDELPEPLRKETVGQPVTDVSTRALRQMHAMNQFQISVGRMVTNRASSEPVREYSERIVRDHRVAEQRVQDLAAQIDVSLTPFDLKTMAKQPDSKLSETERVMVEIWNRLEEAESNTLGTSYVRAMQKSHRRAIEMLDTTVVTIEVDEVAGFVENILPILEQHRRLAGIVRNKLQDGDQA